MACTLRVSTCPLSSSAFVTRNCVRSHVALAGATNGRGRALAVQPRAQVSDKVEPRLLVQHLPHPHAPATPPRSCHTPTLLPHPHAPATPPRSCHTPTLLPHPHAPATPPRSCHTTPTLLPHPHAPATPPHSPSHSTSTPSLPHPSLCLHLPSAVVFNELKSLGLKSISPEEAAAMAYGTTDGSEASEGSGSGSTEGSGSGRAVLLDVREAGDYEEVHARGAASAPLFRLIQGSDLTAWARRVGYAAMGDFKGTERNPELLKQAEAAVGGDKSRTVIVMCGRGGTLQNVSMRKGMEFRDPDKRFGLQSRSLKACYELHVAGFSSILHLDGGLNLWLHKKLPSEP
ncbi:unnamed protein product [Closterium sp. Naga37s-1]|nr:unnamed protein product [Closterium sp. Naga37s-1]